ncbi:MAG: NAD(+) synthase [Firmicutes bacterium]|nr:NAD(+) synthase [Bacillota bacterium]
MNHFFNLYNQGFIRTAVATVQVRVADPAFNVTQTVELARQAAAEHAVLTVFPELNLSAYSNQDLFRQQALLATTENEIKRLLKETATMETILVVGAPVAIGGQLYNCALVTYHGQILGIVPKSYLPNFRQLSESRQFRPGYFAMDKTVTYCGQTNIPFGTDLLFKVTNIPDFTFAVEICEDLQVPVPPSSLAALAGATVIANLSASGAAVDRVAQRHALIANQSARCRAAYLCAEAGLGESTTDLAWDGHALIYENGQLLAEAKPFAQNSQLVFAEIDLDLLRQERMQINIFAENAHRLQKQLLYRTIECEVTLPPGKLLLQRTYERFPYVPAGQKERHRRCRETFAIQVQGLVKRLLATGIKQIIVGVSGGLDSTWALLVAAKAVDQLGLPRTSIRAFTMPGFATSSRTKENSWRLIQALGVSGEELDIRPGSLQMLKDIGHPAAGGEEVYDTTYENVQAGQRTALLFRLANRHRGLVLGTGDLSEIALGWTTYGVGDHMSHYNVNAGVPKTLIQHLIYWYANLDQGEEEINRILLDILNTDISPELVPGTDQKGQPIQRTEDFIGPYELQDFNLYYLTQLGYRPGKVAFLAYHAWRDKTAGQWPDTPENMRTEYTFSEIKQWLQVFCRRFYGNSQFKRSAMPDGPQVGPGSSLSPRGGWRAPTDAVATVWLNELQRIPNTDTEEPSEDS